MGQAQTTVTAPLSKNWKASKGSISRNEKLQVRLNQVNPKIQLGEMGILEWNLTVKAHGKQEIYYQFSIEYPPELTLYGLNI